MDLEPPVDQVSNGTIGFDLTCTLCGYNLRTLASDSDCPECGQKVSVSIRGDYLKHSDPLWLARLQIGVGLASLALFLICADYVLSFLCYALSIYTPARALAYTGYSISALYDIALWLATTPESATQRIERGFEVRKLIRVAIVGDILLQLMVAGIFGIRMMGLPYIGSIVTGALIAFTFFRYLRTIALRVPAQRIYRDLSLVMYGLSFSILLRYLSPLLVSLSPTTTPRRASDKPDLAMTLPLCAYILFAIYGIVLLRRLSRTLAPISLESRDNWHKRPENAV